jgi:hypothetical protein
MVGGMEYFVEGGVESHTFKVKRVRTEVFIMDDIVDVDGSCVGCVEGRLFFKKEGRG